MVRKIVLSLIAVFVFLAYATAQNRQISGTVSDANGHPVAGATVIVDGTSLGTTTNTAGEYTLSAPANGTLVVTFVGFEPQQLPIAGKTRINVTMKEDAQAIDDVIVVAFGTAKKEAFTGSAAVIKSDEIAKVQTSNVATALIGRARREISARPPRSASAVSVRSTPARSRSGLWTACPMKAT